MTIDDLCTATGIGRNSYYNKIRGDRCFNTEEIDAIARVLGCDPLLILEEASAKAQIESDAQLAKKSVCSYANTGGQAGRHQGRTGSIRGAAVTTDLEQEARWYAKRVIITPMQTGYQGLYDANTETIYIADDLTPTQYRCVLAHEISHAKHRDRGGHADRYTEQRADIEAARMLISQVEYQTAENIYDGDETLMAKEMNVMPWIIQAYKQWLHDNVAA